jgi:hypothetical protein
MKLFISWSGGTSQQIAQQLRSWVPLILPSVTPFITTTDIEKGAKWQGEISRELDQSNYGVACLTADSLDSLWLAFEAGALSKHLQQGRVATVLFGIEHAAVPPPLNIFQGTLFNERDFRQLVSNIDAAAPEDQRRGEAQLDVVFPLLWPRVAEPISLILQNATAPAAKPAAATPDWSTIAQEMMALLKQQNAILSAPEKFLSPVLEMLEPMLISIPASAGRTAVLRALWGTASTAPDSWLASYRNLPSEPPDQPANTGTNTEAGKKP